MYLVFIFNVFYNQGMTNSSSFYKSMSERFPLTHTILDQSLGRYVLHQGSVSKFVDIMHDTGQGPEAQFVVRWGRLDRTNHQTRRENAQNVYGTVLKIQRQQYKLEDRTVNSWRLEEKKLLEASLKDAVLKKEATEDVPVSSSPKHKM